MPKIAPFQQYTSQYDEWFRKNRLAYEAELRAIKSLAPTDGYSMEVGAGTGRFAFPLGVKVGVDPSSKMIKIAQKRGINVVLGVAEKLPFVNSKFDYVFMVTTVCFLDDISDAFKEVYRVVKKGGYLIIGLLDRNSFLGRTYLKGKNKNVFYKESTFYTVDEVIEIMKQAGFDNFEFRQTIFQNPSKITENEPVKSGYGEGLFAVIRGRKKLV